MFPFKNPRREGTSFEPVAWFSWPPTDTLATSYELKLFFMNAAEPLKNQLGLLALPTLEERESLDMGAYTMDSKGQTVSSFSLLLP